MVSAWHLMKPQRMTAIINVLKCLTMNIASKQAIWVFLNLIRIINIAHDKNNIISTINEPQSGHNIIWYVFGIIYFIIYT